MILWFLSVHDGVDLKEFLPKMIIRFKAILCAGGRSEKNSLYYCADFTSI